MTKTDIVKILCYTNVCHNGIRQFINSFWLKNLSKRQMWCIEFCKLGIESIWMKINWNGIFSHNALIIADHFLTVKINKHGIRLNKEFLPKINLVIKWRWFVKPARKNRKTSCFKGISIHKKNPSKRSISKFRKRVVDPIIPTTKGSILWVLFPTHIRTFIYSGSQKLLPRLPRSIQYCFNNFWILLILFSSSIWLKYVSAPWLKATKN